MGITFDDLGSMVPMGRIGQATEIAQAVVFLCSDAASYITGQPKRDRWWIYSRLNRDLPWQISFCDRSSE